MCGEYESTVNTVGYNSKIFIHFLMERTWRFVVVNVVNVVCFGGGGGGGGVNEVFCKR